MTEDENELRSLMNTILGIAQDNLLRDGFLQPCGLIFTATGLSKIVEFHFKGIKQKRRAQADFKREVIRHGGIAVVIVMEAWFAFAPDLPTDLTISLEHYPKRREAIFIEAVCLNGPRLALIQPFRKYGSKIVLEEPIRPGPEFTWDSEWTGSIWAHIVEGQA